MVGNLGRKYKGGIKNMALVCKIRHTRNILSDELKSNGSKQFNLGLIRNATKGAKTTNIARLERNLEGQITLICRHEDMQATSNLANAVETTKVEEPVTKTSTKEASTEEIFDKERLEVNTSRVQNVYVRKRKQSNASKIAIDNSIVEQVKDEGLFDGRVIKHYVRRPNGQRVATNVTTNPSQLMMISTSNRKKDNHKVEPHMDTSTLIEREENLHVFQSRLKKKNQPPLIEHHSQIHTKIESECNINVFQRRSKKYHMPLVEHVDVPARVEMEKNLIVFQRRSKRNPPLDVEQSSHVSTKDETKDNVNVFLNRSKTNPLWRMPCRNNIVKVVNGTHSLEGYIRADHQPTWLPDGWTLEIRHGDATTYTKDKCYHDKKSRHIFHSKYEVLQFLKGGGMVGKEVSLQNKKKLPFPIVPNKQPNFQRTRSRLSQFELDSSTTSSSPSTNVHHACMKTMSMRPTYALSNEANGIDPTWARLNGSNGAIDTSNGIEDQCKKDGTTKDGGILAPHGGVANRFQLLRSRDGIQLSSMSPKSIVKSPSNQANKENKEKLIFKLKRKHVDSEVGKGRSNQPMYEIVHVEKASSSSSILTKQEKKVAIGIKTC